MNVPFSCYGDASPGRPCDAQPTDDAGYTLFCCAPACRIRDPASSSCAGPATEYGCDDPLTPSSADAAISCLQFPPATGWHTYCCAPPDTCFGSTPAWRQEFYTVCSPSTEAYFCTGSAEALPPGKTCVASALDGGFSGLQGYCCTDSSDATVDAGDSGDASALSLTGD